MTVMLSVSVWNFTPVQLNLLNRPRGDVIVVRPDAVEAVVVAEPIESLLSERVDVAADAAVDDSVADLDEIIAGARIDRDEVQRMRAVDADRVVPLCRR